MSRARDVLTSLAEMQKRKRIDTRRGRKRNLVKLTYNDLRRSTQIIRQQQNPNGRVEYVGSKVSTRNKQLIFRFETRAVTPGFRKYAQTVIIHKMEYEDEKTKKTPLRINTGDGNFVFSNKVSSAKNPISVRCSCFTGDTLVPLADGTKVPIKDLVGRYSFFVYAYDEKKKKRVIAEAGNAQKYAENSELLAVTLDNGYVIRCTLDHKFLLNDGRVVEAQHLEENDSLVALYRKLSEGAVDDSRIGYEQYQENDKWEYTHVAADDYNVRHGVRGLLNGFKKRFVRHHMDFRKLNNSPLNILRMGPKHHHMYHSLHAKKNFEVNGNPMHRSGAGESQKITRELRGTNIGMGYHFMAHLPEVHANCTAKQRELVAQGKHHLQHIPYEERWAVKECLKGTHHWQTEGHKIRTADIQREKFIQGTHALLNAPNAKKSIKLRKWFDELGPSVTTINYDLSNSLGYSCPDRVRSGLELILEECGHAFLARTGPRNVYQLHVTDGSGNHKVKKVERIKEREDVYCITVPEFGNFAIVADEADTLNSAVFVKNCSNFYFQWWYFDNRDKALAGPKMKPYTRLTPLPPAPGAYPVQNEPEVPGLCKHLLACMRFLQRNKIMTRS